MAHCTTLFVGVNQHKDTLPVAYAPDDRREEPTYLGPIGTRLRHAGTQPPVQGELDAQHLERSSLSGHKPARVTCRVTVIRPNRRMRTRMSGGVGGGS
jgi:hypothetical protein